MAFEPKYKITPAVAKSLSSIEVSRTLMEDLPTTFKMMASLRETARIASTHHSTAIEGNRLTIDEVRKVIEEYAHFSHREKDEAEVVNYYRALDQVDVLAASPEAINEKDIQLLHGISFLGKEKPTPYRDGQNVIRAGRLVVYIPPKAKEVPDLMKDLVEWISQSINDELPIPIIAALAHYQFATIHPYCDGNGRTARLLVSLILHKYGYGLKGIYSLEEYYALDLQSYYAALTVGSDEDYYDGARALADVTGFLEYFILGMAQAFEKVVSKARAVKEAGNLDQAAQLRELSQQQKQVLQLFINSKEISAKELGAFFAVGDRQARSLCQKWVTEGFLEISNPAPKSRRYVLNEKYERLISN